MSPLLTEEQALCISLTKGHLVIEAGAGAGKTFVLCERVKHLLKKDMGVHEIMLVTFSREAFKSLEQRLLAQGVEGVSVSTIDGLFASLVDFLYPVWFSETFEKEILPKKLYLKEEVIVWKVLKKKLKDFFSLLHEDKKLRPYFMDFLLSGAFLSFEESRFGRGYLESILRLMTSPAFLVTEEMILAQAKIHPAALPMLKEIHRIAREAYFQRLKVGDMTYGDRTVFLYQNIKKYSLPFVLKELIVDEYQDTNKIQHHILWTLAEKFNARMVVVGDPKQSIYGFRDAHVEILHSLKQDPAWNHLILKKNFRSDAQLLEEINHLSELVFLERPEEPAVFKGSYFEKIAQTRYVPFLRLEPGLLRQEKNQKFERGNVHFITVSSPRYKLYEGTILAFTDYLEVFLKQLIEKGGSLSQVCLISETNKALEDLFYELKKRQIPCALPEKNAKQKVFSEENRIGLLLIKLMTDRVSKFELYEILSSPLLLWNQTFLSQIFSKLSLYRSSLEGVLNNKDYEKISWTSLFPPEEPKDCFSEFLKSLKEIRKISDVFAGWQILRTECVFSFSEKKEISYPFFQKMDGFAVLLEKVAVQITTQDPKEILKLISFDLKQWKTDLYSYDFQEERHDSLSMRTVHGAKGLEWDYVFFWPGKKQYDKKTSLEMCYVLPDEAQFSLSWRLSDLDKLSLAPYENNKDFPYEDESEGVFFQEYSRLKELYFERQRVFYTALTRAKTSLFLVQPVPYHASLRKSLLEDLEETKTSFPLERAFLLRYLKLKSTLPFGSKKELEALSEKTDFLSEGVGIHHYPCEWVEQAIIQKESQSLSVLNDNKDKEHRGESSALLLPQINRNEIKNVWLGDRGELDIWGKKEENKEGIQEGKEPQEGGIILEEVLFGKKRKGGGSVSFFATKTSLQRRHEGSLLHAQMSRHSGLHKEFEALSHQHGFLSYYEWDVWYKRDGKRERKILDFVTCFPMSVLPQAYRSLSYVGMEGKACSLEAQEGLCLVVIDFKTGKVSSSYTAQIQEYMKLAQEWYQFSQNKDSKSVSFTTLGFLYYVSSAHVSSSDFVEQSPDSLRKDFSSDREHKGQIFCYCLTEQKASTV